MDIWSIIIYILIGIGLFFNIVAVIGLYRFPDTYTRLHAATKCTTFGAIFLILAVIVNAVDIWISEGSVLPQSILITRAIIVIVLLLITNATSAHAIARAAYRSGEKPQQAVVDDLEGVDHG